MTGAAPRARTGQGYVAVVPRFHAVPVCESARDSALSYPMSPFRIPSSASLEAQRVAIAGDGRREARDADPEMAEPKDGQVER